MNNVTVRKVRAGRLLARLSPSLRQALRGVRKLHFHNSMTDEELVARTLAIALSHWDCGLARAVGADRNYCWAEGVDQTEFYIRKLQAVWGKAPARS